MKFKNILVTLEPMGLKIHPTEDSWSTGSDYTSIVKCFTESADEIWLKQDRSDFFLVDKPKVEVSSFERRPLFEMLEALASQDFVVKDKRYKTIKF